MLGNLWNAIFGNLDMVKVSALIAAASFCWEKATTWSAKRRSEVQAKTDEVVMDAINQAIFDTSASVGNLGKEMKIPKDLGTLLLRQSVNSAEAIAESRGVDLRRVLGGSIAVRGAVEGAFKQINASLKASSATPFEVVLPDPEIDDEEEETDDESIEDNSDGSGSGDGECVRQDESEAGIPGPWSLGKE